MDRVDMLIAKDVEVPNTDMSVPDAVSRAAHSTVTDCAFPLMLMMWPPLAVSAVFVAQLNAAAVDCVIDESARNTLPPDDTVVDPVIAKRNVVVIAGTMCTAVDEQLMEPDDIVTVKLVVGALEQYTHVEPEILPPDSDKIKDVTAPVMETPPAEPEAPIVTPIADPPPTRTTGV